MEFKNILLASGIAAAVMVIVFFAILYPGDLVSDESKTDFLQGNHNNSDIICDIIGYTNVIEARYNTSLPFPDYITEKYGEILIPADIMTCSLVEFDDFGLKQDNSTSFLIRIKDKEYNVNLIYTGSQLRKDINHSVDSYSCMIENSGYSGDVFALLVQSRDLSGKNFSYFIFNVNFQSEFSENYGIYIKPVQATESAMKSPRLLYAIYSSDDIDHDYMLPIPGE
ncbi:MAG: hypothetical protein PHV39_05395 [Methanomicrobium sp.]|nr:hypothetical protein [Methanomicrobium sp.]